MPDPMTSGATQLGERINALWHDTGRAGVVVHARFLSRRNPGVLAWIPTVPEIANKIAANSARM